MTEALTLLGNILNFFTNTGAFLVGAVHWLSSALFPPELQTWFLGTISTPSQTWNTQSVYENVYQAVQGPALLIAAVASAGRVLRATLDHRVPAAHVVMDAMPRFLLAVAMIGIPGTHVSPLYSLAAFSINAGITVTGTLFSVLLQASLLRGLHPGEGWFDHIVVVVGNAGNDAVAVIIGAIPLLALTIYAAFLMIARTVMLGFCIATAPLCMATAVFDHHNRFVHWWLDLFIGVLLTPMVLAISVALSITVASGLVAIPPIGPILAFVVLCGGLWFASKMVHHISWRHFSHGSAMAGFAGGVAAMLSPVHKLATVGFMAEALGANRSGDNAAINMMKRVGLAAQGMSSASVVAPSLLAGGVSNLNTVKQPLPSGVSTPDMTQALSPSGRAAVEGSELLFSQHAFSAFANGQPRLIGTLTRDHPAGTIPSAARASIAWDRTSRTDRSAFADDFLSHWLASDISHSDFGQDDRAAPHSVAA